MKVITIMSIEQDNRCLTMYDESYCMMTNNDHNHIIYNMNNYKDCNINCINLNDNNINKQNANKNNNTDYYEGKNSHLQEKENKTNSKKLKFIEDNEDEDEDEKDLTSLNWLTELRNQTVCLMNLPLEDTDEIAKSKCQKFKETCQQQYDGQLLQNYRHYHQQQKQLVQKHILSSEMKKNQSRKDKTHARYQIKRPTPNERYEIFLNKIKRDQEIYERSEQNFQLNASEKPPFNYSHIIGMAMLETGRKITLQQICSWIERKFAFFRVRKKWNNSIRHNLSLHPCFRKIGRGKDEKGKGGYWELGIDSKKCEIRRRIRNRKSINKTTNKQNSSIPNGRLNRKNSILPISSETNVTNILDNIQTDMKNDGWLSPERNCILLLPEKSINSEHGNSMNTDFTNEEIIVANKFLDTHPIQNQEYELETIIVKTDNDIVHQWTDDQNIIHVTATDITSNIVNENEDSSKQQQQQEQHLLHNIAQFEADYIQINDSDKFDSKELQTTNYLTTTENNNRNCEHFGIVNTSTTISRMIPTTNISNIASPTAMTTTNVIVEQLPQPLDFQTCFISKANDFTNSNTNSLCSSSFSFLQPTVTVNYDYQNLANETCQSTYIDGIDEAFQYLRSIDSSRSEDVLENLFDISVSDY